MKIRKGVRPLHIFALLALCFATPALAQEGEALYKEHCASCHNRGVDRAPSFDVLRKMSPQHILEVLEFGSMVSMTHSNPLRPCRCAILLIDPVDILSRTKTS